MKVFKIWASPRDEIGLVTDMHSLSRISQQLLLISYKNAPALLFILGLTWVFLFSAVNVTTGELKPRGLYVDEHALLVQSQMFRKPKVQSAPYIDFNNTSLCHFLDLSLLQCSEHTESKDDNFMTEIRVLPSKSKVLLESTVLVIHYTPEDVCIIKEVLSLVGSVAANLHHANWNARQVIILLVPKASNAGSGENSGFIINSWLQRHHKPSLSQLHENELNLLSARDQHPLGSIGMLREAYVIDLTDSDLCTSSDHLNNQFGFNALGLLHTGSNGVLPNMDMLSYPLSMYPEVMHTESEKCAIELHNSSSSQMLTYLDRTNEDSVIARLIRKIFLVWNEVDSNVYLKGYKDRSMGLLCSIYTLASGIPTGQHAHFLDYNIDSVTIKPERQRIRQRQRLKGDRTGQQSGKKGAAKTPASYINDSSEKADYGREKLLEVAYSLLYISNNLHEELHHSHFFYIMMGSNYFTGISEYGFTAAVFLSALLFLYLHLSTHCTQAGVQRAVVYCAVSFTPVVVWTLSMAQGLFSYASAPRSCISATPYNGALWSMLCEKTNITFALYMITCSSIALCAAHVAPTDRSRGDHVDSDSDILSYVVTAAVTSNDALTAAPAAATTTAGDSCVDTEGTSAEQTPRAEVPVPDKSVQAVLALMLLIILSGSFAHNFALGLLCSVQLVPSLIIVIQGTTGTVAGRAARFGSSRQRNFWSVLVLGAIVLLHVVNIRRLSGMWERDQLAAIPAALALCMNALVGCIAAAALPVYLNMC